jgi:hypothetical protein
VPPAGVPGRDPIRPGAIRRSGRLKPAERGATISHIDDLIERIRGLDEQIQLEFDKKRDDFRFVVDERRIRFSEEVAAIQRGSRTGLFSYLTGATVLTAVTAPILYLGIVPLVLLDLFVNGYQAICFPVYGIPKAKRSDHIVLDRVDLPYLNALEKLNCAYCGYANGLASQFREVAARTEQHWCPIKHARRTLAVHDRYPGFFEYGDAESYRLGLERLRSAMTRGEGKS